MFVNKSRTRDCKPIWHSKLVFCIDKTKISREQWKRWQLKAKIWVIAERTNNNFPRNKTSWLGELAVKDQMRRIWFSGSVAQGSVVWWTLCGWWLAKVFFTAVLELVMQVRKYGVAWRTQTRALKKTRRIYFRSGEYYTRMKRSQKTSLHSFMGNF